MLNSWPVSDLSFCFWVQDVLPDTDVDDFLGFVLSANITKAVVTHQSSGVLRL